MKPAKDPSNGYDERADEFSSRRSSTIGVPEVQAWAATLPKGARVLDLGCGLGAPIGKALAQAGCDIYGIDASPRMIAAFTQQLPNARAACEAVEDSSFYDTTFDGIVAWGLMFLLAPDAQERVIAKAAVALKRGGSFLFTAPHQTCSWSDNLTGTLSVSLGRDEYARILDANGLTLVRELDDAGENHYYISTKR